MERREEFAERLIHDGKSPEYTAEESGGTAYYVADHYLSFHLSDEMELQAAVSEDKTVGSESYAWLLWPDVFAETPDETMLLDTEMIQSEGLSEEFGSDGCTRHTRLYHAIDTRLIEYVGQDKMDAFVEKYGWEEDGNIMNFVTFCKIPKDELNILPGGDLIDYFMVDLKERLADEALFSSLEFAKVNTHLTALDRERLTQAVQKDVRELEKMLSILKLLE